FAYISQASGIGTANNQLYIQKQVSGSATNLCMFSSLTPAAGDLITTAAIGTQSCLYYNGYLILAVTDSGVTSGKPGVHVVPDLHIVDAQLNNWSAGGFQNTPNPPNLTNFLFS